MHSPRRRSLRTRPAFRHAALLSAFVLLAACSSISGSALRPVVGTATTPPTTTGSAAGQITEPSVLPGGSGTATTSGAPVPTPAGTTSTGPVPTGAGAVPAGLQKFYGQTLAWGPCASYATDATATSLYGDPNIQCARLTVPLAYSNPTGQTVSMGVLRKVATDRSARIGSLVTDPGGPGSSGMEWLASYVVGDTAADAGAAQKTVAGLNQKFDLVGIDPRGIGSSLPAVQCQTDAEKDKTFATDTRSRNQADVDAANALTKQIVSECLANTGKAQGIDSKTFFANIGTRDVAKDLDVLRAVLGDSKLSYLGFSYGTQIGWEYAEQFPKNVRAILFDGVEAPNVDPASSALGQQKGFETAFQNFAAYCATSSPGCALGTDPSKALAIFQGLVRPLLDKPLALAGGRTLTFASAITGVTWGLYFTQFQTALAQGLLALKAGDGRILMQLADSYNGRDAQGHYSNEQEAFNAVRCVDGPRKTDPAEVTKFNAAVAAAGPFGATGDPAGAIFDICALWPVPPTTLPHTLHISGLPKTLVVSTTGDPATPYQDGVDLAQQINATLLTVKGVRHTSYLSNGLSCVDDIGNAYLESLTLPTAAPTCS